MGIVVREQVVLGMCPCGNSSNQAASDTHQVCTTFWKMRNWYIIMLVSTGKSGKLNVDILLWGFLMCTLCQVWGGYGLVDCTRNMGKWVHCGGLSQGYVGINQFGGVNQRVCPGGWTVVTQGYVTVGAAGYADVRCMSGWISLVGWIRGYARVGALW
jgi:hypothetical protein